MGSHPAQHHGGETQVEPQQLQRYTIETVRLLPTLPTS
jgi:hypothetical protein